MHESQWSQPKVYYNGILYLPNFSIIYLLFFYVCLYAYGWGFPFVLVIIALATTKFETIPGSIICFLPSEGWQQYPKNNLN